MCVIDTLSDNRPQWGLARESTARAFKRVPPARSWWSTPRRVLAVSSLPPSVARGHDLGTTSRQAAGRRSCTVPRSMRRPRMTPGRSRSRPVGIPGPRVPRRPSPGSQSHKARHGVCPRAETVRSRTTCLRGHDRLMTISATTGETLARRSPATKLRPRRPAPPPQSAPEIAAPRPDENSPQGDRRTAAGKHGQRSKGRHLQQRRNRN